MDTGVKFVSKEDVLREHCVAAIRQLENSGRGHAARLGLLQFLDKTYPPPSGLDNKNVEAMITLLRAATQGGIAGSVIDMLGGEYFKEGY